MRRATAVVYCKEAGAVILIIEGVILSCKYCGEVLRVPKKASARSFMITFNKFKRVHDWECEANAKAKQKVNQAKLLAKETADKAIYHMINNQSKL